MGISSILLKRMSEGGRDALVLRLNLGTVVPLVFEKTPRSVYWKYENYTNSYHRGHRGRDRMVVGFTNYPISAYHH